MLERYVALLPTKYIFESQKISVAISMGVDGFMIRIVSSIRLLVNLILLTKKTINNILEYKIKC